MWPAWRPIDHRDVEAYFDELIRALLSSRLEYAGSQIAWTRFMHDLIGKTMHGEFDPGRAIIRLRKYLRLAGIPIDGIEADFLESGTFVYLVEMAGRILERGYGPQLEEALLDKPRHQRILKALDRPVLLVDPWPHQEAALAAWNRGNFRGILELATATGKTVIGLLAIADAYAQKPRPKVVVVAHSNALLEQWKREAIQKLALPLDHITNLDQLRHGGGVAFTTVQGINARLRAGTPVPQVDLLVVDEVHHYASPAFRESVIALEGTMRMGLSATIEGEREQPLRRAIGPTLYVLKVKEAIESGLLPSFRWSVYPTPMEPWEADEFKRLGKQIVEVFPYVKRDTPAFIRKRWGEVQSLAMFFRVSERVRYMGRREELPESWTRLHSLVVSRRWIIHRSQPKIRDAIELATAVGKQHKTIVFTMDIGTTQTIAGQLRSRGIHVFEAHSGLKKDGATKAIDQFRAAVEGVLVSPKLLDEGVDIPDAEVGINVASTKTRIQLVQRLGRILRNQAGKEPHFHHFLSILPEQEHIDSLDAAETVADLNWILDLSTIFGISPTISQLADSVDEARFATIVRRGRKDWQQILRHDEFQVDGLDGTFQPGKLVAAFSEEQARHLLALWHKHGLPITEGQDLDAVEWDAFTSEGREQVPIEGWWWIHTLFHDSPVQLKRALETTAGCRLRDAIGARVEVTVVPEPAVPEPARSHPPKHQTTAAKKPLPEPVEAFEDRRVAKGRWNAHAAKHPRWLAALANAWDSGVSLQCPNCLVRVEVPRGKAPTCGNCGHR